MHRNKNPKLINTYSGLAKLYANGNQEVLNKFQEFARSRHLYDPHFFLGTLNEKKVNLFTAMFGNKFGSEIRINFERLQNCGAALIYSLHLVQYQVHNARDINTNERLVKDAQCLFPDFNLVYAFVEDHLLKYAVKEVTKANKKVLAYINKGAYKEYCRSIHNKAMMEIPMFWLDGHKCKELFERLGFGHKGYIYGERKEYATKPLTKNEMAIMSLFMKRGDEDLAAFIKDVEANGLSNTFKAWYKAKKFLDANIVCLMINRKFGLRSKAFKRFCAKLEGVSFTSMINKYAADKRFRDRRSATATLQSK